MHVVEISIIKRENSLQLLIKTRSLTQVSCNKNHQSSCRMCTQVRITTSDGTSITNSNNEVKEAERKLTINSLMKYWQTSSSRNTVEQINNLSRNRYSMNWKANTATLTQKWTRTTCCTWYRGYRKSKPFDNTHTEKWHIDFRFYTNWLISPIN